MKKKDSMLIGIGIFIIGCLVMAIGIPDKFFVLLAGFLIAVLGVLIKGQ